MRGIDRRHIEVITVLLIGLAIPAIHRSMADDLSREPWLKPPVLRPGDTIMIVAPGSRPDRAKVEAAADQFRRMGFRVLVPRDLYRRDESADYLAGSDDRRVAELNRAIRDPRVAAIFPARGGYGLTRILDRIDYAALKKHPKVVTGYSDITALHLAIARKVHLVTFHSPMPQSSLWRTDGDYRYSADVFWSQVSRPAAGVANGGGYIIKLPAGEQKPVRVVGGTATGRLTGGNLTLICATLGTPYALEADGKILFVEDTGEAAYRVDRMFSQLKLAGILDRVSGLIVGTFDDTDVAAVQRVIRGYVASLHVPVVMGFPVGHTARNATLPCGVRAELDADTPRLRIIEDPVTSN